MKYIATSKYFIFAVAASSCPPSRRLPPKALALPAPIYRTLVHCSFRVRLMSADAADEDDFDWEAAVREIDSACERAVASSSAGPSTSYARSPPHGAAPFAVPARVARAPAAGRQSTLDGFVKSRGGNGSGLGAPGAHGGLCGAGKNKSRGGNGSGLGGLGADEGLCRASKNPGRNGFGISSDNDGEGRPEVAVDMEAAKTWIYPINIPLREYQLSIAEICLFSNTLVALPTGLGKTLIAAVVMYNYFRWFPEGKIVFAAPSRPLVMQQIEACLNIVGIPQEYSMDMTGVISPPKRLKLWKTKRVFFVTPQVLEKDIQSGSCPAKKLVCLVVDEAHRAVGNHAYCVAVRELMAIPVQLRVLALTATPGSKHQAIQNVIDNLQISTLEYRNESHGDVSPYVHDRTLELVKVEVGNSALEISGLLLEVVKPFVHKLCSEAGLHSRDLTTLSPYQLLNSLNDYKERCPHADSKSKEIHSLYYTSISLYHMYKLLSSHGIKPAYSLLEDKLSSCLLRVKNNEFFLKAKNMMKKAIGQGAPSPKLSKMIEILVKHFEQNDPVNSRVIIFSHFRESVKEIMDSLSNIGDTVRATEFVGQSSGKSLKGQNQKLQQAVLEKFRRGEYNVIVATSIGEEGLDIVEVDLVICFDANISSLRMIQRMGRTGRKHDGRVVVLACKGSELKGYLRKQASGKSIRKHMFDGGLRSFSFHSSPRMVPHICKPQVNFVELSIQKFIHSRSKTKTVVQQKSAVPNKLSDEESSLIARYFHKSEDSVWKASLIAFPHFQSFPTRVDRVYHSYRAKEMFIAAVQCLQNPSCNIDPMIDVQVNDSSEHLVGSASSALESDNNCNKESPFNHEKLDISCDNLPAESCSVPNPSRLHYCHVSNFDASGCSLHTFLYNTDFVTVDVHGVVAIASVPSLPFTRDFLSRKSNMPHLGFNRKGMTSFDIPMCNEFSNPECISTKNKTISVVGASLAGDIYGPVNDAELSPRLTHLMEKGIVPESPIVNSHHCPSSNYPSPIPADEDGINDLQKCTSTSLGGEPSISKDLSNHSDCADAFPKPRRGQPACEAKLQPNDSNIISPINIDTDHSSSLKHMNTSLSEDWQPNSEEVRKFNENQAKYKRLRKCADVDKKLPCMNLEERMNIAAKKQCNKGQQKLPRHVNIFIEEEADVSIDAMVSGDEEDMDDDNYDDSFIDDRINLTEDGTPAQNSGDMMAFYRRSLLTQSPGAGPFCYTTTTPGEQNSVKSSEIGSCSSKRKRLFLPTPEGTSVSGNRNDVQYSVSKQLVYERTSLLAINEGIDQVIMDQSTSQFRKRKLSFPQSPIVAQAENPLEKETQGNLLQHSQCDNGYTDIFCDDDFYKSLDLDALEAQATRILKNRTDESATIVSNPMQTSSLAKKANSIEPTTGSPTFDLGI